MLQRVRLLVLTFVAASPLNAQMPMVNSGDYKEAPPISSVMVRGVSSATSNGNETIEKGQFGTQRHHSGYAVITTLEVGLARTVVASSSGYRQTKPLSTSAYCGDEQSVRTCHEGESATVFIRTWGIPNITNGFFTYEATSTNHPYNTGSVRLYIN